MVVVMLLSLVLARIKEDTIVLSKKLVLVPP